MLCPVVFHRESLLPKLEYQGVVKKPNIWEKEICIPIARIYRRKVHPVVIGKNYQTVCIATVLVDCDF